MSYRGYTESIEVLIDILDELREVKELLKQKQIEQPNPQKKVTVSANKQTGTGVRRTN